MSTPHPGLLIGLIVLAVIGAACARGSVAEETTTAPPARISSSQQPITSEAPDTTGVVVVSIDSATYEFAAARCAVAVDVFVVDAANDQGGTLQIRHASPPTREPAEPSMAVFVLEAGDRWEAPPAAISFQTYDPESGLAAGSVPVNMTGSTGAEATAAFEVRCSASA